MLNRRITATPNCEDASCRKDDRLLKKKVGMGIIRNSSAIAGRATRNAVHPMIASATPASTTISA